MATIVDVAASDPVLAAWSPDWTATQDLSVSSVSPLKGGPVLVDARMLKVGKRAIFVSADVYDGSGIDDFDELQKRIDLAESGRSHIDVVARCFATFARISRNAAKGVETYDPINWLGTIRRRSSGRSDAGPLNERIGLKVCNSDAGIVEVANSPYVANSIGTINGGVQATIVEAAAEAMRPGKVVTDLQIHFLAPMKVGPARTVGCVIRDATDHSALLIRLLDAGDSERVFAVAKVILQSVI